MKAGRCEMMDPDPKATQKLPIYTKQYYAATKVSLLPTTLLQAGLLEHSISTSCAWCSLIQDTSGLKKGGLHHLPSKEYAVSNELTSDIGCKCQ